MAKTRQQKEEILNKLVSAFDESASTTFVHFTGISVSEETEIRRAVREKGLRYYVAKKTLMRKAWEKVGAKGEEPELEGEIAVVYGDREDPTASAREIYQFVKQLKDKLSIVGGIYQGEFKDAVAMNEIATIPPVEILRGMFVNVINSPIQGLVVALNQIADKKSE